MNNDTRQTREALVIKSTGSWYTLCDSLTSERLEARLSGRIRLQGRRSTNPVVVGDRVDYYLESTPSPKSTESGRPRNKKGRRKSHTESISARACTNHDEETLSVSLPDPETAPMLPTTDANETTQSACSIPTPSDSRDETTLHTSPLAKGTPDAASSESLTPTGVITHIHERHNYIIRRASNLSRESHIIASNIDQAFLVTTLAFPETSFEFIDRFLVTAEAYHIPTTLVLNKTDLYDTPELRDKRALFLDTYRGAGYEVMEVAAASGQGITPLRERLQGRVSLLSGNSGVGKSTLIQAVDPTLHPRIGAISDYHHRGRHTTTFSEMYALQGGGWLIDTPGIKGFGLIDLSGEEVGRYFPDLFRWAPQCNYYNCTHTHEPGCAVKEAVERGEIRSTRYISYLKLLEEDEKYRQ